MIIIGEKINGAIPSIKKAIAEHDEKLVRERTRMQAERVPAHVFGMERKVD